MGDPKQAIYGFRGADPALMDAAVVTLLEGEPPETPELIFVDVDFFTIRAWQHSQLDRMVSEHARSIGADTAYVRITEDSSSEIRYTVTAYRRR